MGLLKSLLVQYPIIDSTFLEFCASHSVFTVEDFLIHDLDALFTFAEKHSDSQRLKQGIEQLISIVDTLHRPWLNGFELLTDAQQNKQTSSLGMDSFLHVVLREGFVTELVGPSSAGKTQVCLEAAATVAKDYGGGVVFVDTGNCFSASRVSCIVNQSSYSTSVQDNHEPLYKIMQNIWCYSVFDIFSLLDVLHQVESQFKSLMQRGQQSVRLLIVDSFSSLIIPVLGGGGPYGHALMNSTGNLLKKIAHDYNVCVLVTNHMVGGEGGSVKPALGESWKFIPHVRLLLSRDRESNICSISVLKHPSIAAGNQAKFKMSDDDQVSSIRERRGR